MLKWIPFSQIKDLKEIARGGYGIIYQANWKDETVKTVAIKKFLNQKDFNGYFLNELRSHFKCCNCGCINRCYGITKDPKSNDYMLVLQFAKGGNLHDFLKTNFSNITWEEKVEILYQISIGLRNIHDKDFIHRDIHSGNILYLEPNPQWKINKRWQIGDLGLAQPAQPTNVSNNEIYGVMPYIAPEIFQGADFSKASDVYSMGMIMWELTTGCKPFANIGHNHVLTYSIIDGIRPEITEDTPECIVNLMKRCWDSDPNKRPSMNEIHKTLSEIHKTLSDVKNKEFNKAEQKRLELIRLKRLGPEFTEKLIPKQFIRADH
ncbi:kinase-like domain-containing protein [Glomus cerebriforme]|uniref:Kinase-like domain-containing protein n=1 Tax=Glomus cerebriforme TaxID=658196 RepID=A0A397SXH8_9GLOM|nr:kinase-like domain-containing protein [Glomus cerebriforme]